MPSSCGERRSRKLPPSSDRSAAFSRAAQPARRAMSAALAGGLVLLRSQASLQ